jgi:hypothetical protein
MKGLIILGIMIIVLIISQFIVIQVYNNIATVTIEVESAIGQLNDDGYAQSRFVASGGILKIINMSYIFIYCLFTIRGIVLLKKYFYKEY